MEKQKFEVVINDGDMSDFVIDLNNALIEIGSKARIRLVNDGSSQNVFIVAKNLTQEQADNAFKKYIDAVIG